VGQRVQQALRLLVRVFSSYRLAFVLLMLLLVLTYFGTMAQADRALYDVQKEYFESAFVTVHVGPLPLLLPGAYLLLSVLLVNLVVGGMVRMRRRVASFGVLLTHVGIVVLLVGSFVEHQFSAKGYIRLREGEAADEFRSHDEWEVAVTERLAGGRVREHLIPPEVLEDATGSRQRDARAATLPFAVRLSNYARNGRPRPAGGTRFGIDGYLLDVLEPVKRSDEMNVPGLVVSVRDSGGTQRQAILWGLQQQPWVLEDGGRRFEFDLRRRTWPLGDAGHGFSVRLDTFERQLHPGSGMARSFSSHVTKIEGATAQQVHITMNEPMRHRGYTFYQASWGPSDGQGPLWSQLAVVRNPSDQVPLIACLIIAAGLLFHFGRKLILHVLRESRRVAHEAEEA
jgi:hypothetical protein